MKDKFIISLIFQNISEEMRNSPVNVKARMDTITARKNEKNKKKAMIYHQINITQPYSTLNLEFNVDNASTTRLVVLGRHKKMPTLTDCEFVKIVGDIQERDADCKYNSKCPILPFVDSCQQNNTHFSFVNF